MKLTRTLRNRIPRLAHPHPKKNGKGITPSPVQLTSYYG